MTVQTQPLISVIVPIYNVAPFVVGALQSIDASDFQDFECICVDDGSMDESGHLAADFCSTHTRFKLIRQANKGLSGARNTGLDAATGKYVFFLDSDDYIHPQALGKMYTLAQESRADIVSAGYVHTDQPYEPIQTNLPDKLRCKNFSTTPLRDFLSGKGIKSTVCAKLYRRDKIAALRFIEGIYFEDVPFTVMILAQVMTVLVTDMPVYYYYYNPTSIMKTSFTVQKVNSYITLIRALYAYINQYCPDFLPMVQRRVLNMRFKMMLNQAVRKQKNNQKRKELFEVIQPAVQELYASGMISYDGLRWYHKAALWLLLHAKTSKPALIWMRFAKG